MRADGVGADAIRHDESDEAGRRLRDAEDALRDAGMSAETGSSREPLDGAEDRDPATRPDDELRNELTDAAGE